MHPGVKAPPGVEPIILNMQYLDGEKKGIKMKLFDKIKLGNWRKRPRRG